MPADLAKTKKELIDELEAARTEITELKKINAGRTQAEGTLQENEPMFRAIFEQAAVGVAEIESRTGRFLRINKKYCDIVGFCREKMLEKTFQDITHSDDIQQNLDNMDRLLAGKIASFTMEKRYVHENGNMVWVHLTVSPLWRPDEEPSTHVAMVKDITERKKVEEDLRRSRQELTVRVLEATQKLRWSNTNLRREILRRKQTEKSLRESEDRFRRYFELGLVGMGIASPDHKWLEANEYLCDLLGYSRKELLAKSWTEITHPEDLPLNLVFWEVMAEGKTPGYQMEKRFLCKDGGTIDVNVSVRSVRDEEGGLKYNLALVEDITERKRAEAALQQSEKNTGPSSTP